MYISCFFLGEALRNLAAEVCLQVRKKADCVSEGSFSGFLWAQDDQGQLDVVKYVPAPQNSLVFAPDLSEEYEVSSVATDLKKVEDDKVVAFLKNHYQQHVNISAAHAKMHVCLLCSGHDVSAKNIIEDITRCIGSIQNANITVSVLVLAPELARLANKDWREAIDHGVAAANEQTIVALRQLCSLKRQTHIINDILLIQNTNAQRLALSMDMTTVAQLLAWRFISMVNESQSSSVHLADANEDVVSSFGLSCLSFDRYYYLHYLLHHAYLSVMEREGVQKTHVDVNKVADMAQQCMIGRENVLTTFWNKHVAPRLNSGEREDQIIPVVREKTNEFIDELEKVLTSFISDNNLTLPEKRAVMAQILLSDDDILAGSLFDGKQLTFLDLLRHPMSYFVEYNNLTTTFCKDDQNRVLKDPDTGEPVVEHSVLNRPRNSEGYIHLPIDDIKAMRIKIREASEYIRRMDDEIEDVRRQQNAAVLAQQVVVDSGFLFDESRFRAVAQTLIEHPLSEDYVPEKVTTDKNVDLSYDFTEVKNQAEVGSCAAFAVTAVMEYILKKNKSLSSDLSERFVYYNARKRDGRLGEQGVAVSVVINSMGQMGVCPENLCPYSAAHVDDCPSDEAYSEALKHRIVEAKNIPVTMDVQHNLDQIRTAISEGFPVIASFKVFKAMESGLPFVSMPQEDEKGEDHAMVICGFDDETGFVKVRNSWGVAFGENGYCYMPYAYVAQKKYLNAAYIITQIASTDHVRGVSSRHRISFDGADTAIKIAILSSLRDMKKIQQEVWMDSYKQMYADLIHLNGNLKDKSKRDAIVNDTSQMLEEKRTDQKGFLHKLELEMGVKIENFRRTTRKTAFRMGAFAAVLFLLSFLLLWITESWGWPHTILLCGSILSVLILVGYLVQRRHDLAALKNRLKLEIDEQGMKVGKTEGEIRYLKMHAFVVGQFVDLLSGLYNKLSKLNVSMKSYVNNLSAWYDEEKQNVSTMTVSEKPPFISLLSNEVLDDFYNQKKQQFIPNIHLWELFSQGAYDIAENKVAEFKQILKNSILKNLNNEIGDFSMYDYMESPASYPFLKNGNEQIKQMLSSVITSYSQVLLPQKNNIGNAGLSVFLCHPSDQTAQLKKDLQPYSPSNPQCEQTLVRDALIVVQTQRVDIDNISL